MGDLAENAGWLAIENCNHPNAYRSGHSVEVYGS
jgi:hypothetical protein